MYINYVDVSAEVWHTDDVLSSELSSCQRFPAVYLLDRLVGYAANWHWHMVLALANFATSLIFTSGNSSSPFDVVRFIIKSSLAS